MKKFFFIIFVIFIFNNLQAQIKYGIEAGLNASTIKGNDPGKLGGTSGLLLGINVSYDLFDYISVGSGLFLSQKGVNHYIYGTSVGTERYNYLEIPITLTYNLPIPEAGKTFVFAGGYAASLLNASVSPNNEGLSSDINIGEMFPKGDYGIIMGVGQSFSVSSGTLNFKIKYSLGMVSMDKTYNIFVYGEPLISDGSKKLNNSVISFTIGYTF
jgi:hypothetical protein